MRLSTGTLFAALAAAITLPLLTSALIAPPPPHAITPAQTIASAVRTIGASGGTCPSFTRTLVPRSTGSDVKSYQQYLVSKGLLTADSVTGFFGALTLAATQKLQTQLGVVSAGTAATTGFGVVGLKTRAAIARGCGMAIGKTSAVSGLNPMVGSALKKIVPILRNAQCPAVAFPIGKSCTGKWQEVKGANKCTASWKCVTN